VYRGEADPWSPCPRPERLGRDDETDDLPGRDLCGPGRDDRDHENMADGRLISEDLADGHS